MNECVNELLLKMMILMTDVSFGMLPDQQEKEQKIDLRHHLCFASIRATSVTLSIMSDHNLCRTEERDNFLSRFPPLTPRRFSLSLSLFSFLPHFFFARILISCVTHFLWIPPKISRHQTSICMTRVKRVGDLSRCCP